MKNGGVVGKQEKWISSRFKVLIYIYIFFLFLLSALKTTGIKGTHWTRSWWCGVNEAYLTCGSLSSSNITTTVRTDWSKTRSGQGRPSSRGDAEKVKCYQKPGWKIKIYFIRKRNSTDFFIFLFVHADSSHQCIVSLSL